MKVYITFQSSDYESSTAHRVLDAKDKALAVCRNGAVEWKKRIGYENSEIIPLLQGYRLDDITFTYEEKEVE